MNATPPTRPPRPHCTTSSQSAASAYCEGEARLLRTPRPYALNRKGGYRSVVSRKAYAPTRLLHRNTPTTKSNIPWGYPPVTRINSQAHYRDRNNQNPKNGENYVVRNGQQPLEDGQYPVQISLDVRILDLQMRRLLFVRGGILVPEHQQKRRDPQSEPAQLQVPIEPPPGILLTGTRSSTGAR